MLFYLGKSDTNFIHQPTTLLENFYRIELQYESEGYQYSLQTYLTKCD